MHNFAQHTIDAAANLERLLERLNVDIAGTALYGVFENGTESAANRRILDDCLDIAPGLGRCLSLRHLGGYINTTEVGAVLLQHMAHPSLRRHKDLEWALDAVGKVVDRLDVVGINHRHR